MSACAMDKKGRWRICVAERAMAWAPSPEVILLQTLNPLKCLGTIGAAEFYCDIFKKYVSPFLNIWCVYYNKALEVIPFDP